MAYVNPLISPNTNPGREPRLPGHLQPHADRGFLTGLLLDWQKPPVPRFGFSRHGVLREWGRQTGLAFVKLDWGARDVNADDPSLPWMHPRVGRYFRKRMLLF